MRICIALVLGLIASSHAGCYLAQSARGQLAVMRRREPITRILGSPSTPADLRTQLAAVTSIRNFASHELGLPDNGSYRSYADVGRPYVVWNVVAAPEFAVDPKEWCYPIVGCVAYRGYFAEYKARSFAAALRKQGLDVSVGGVAAYSTLGHFDDPILNTMVNWNDADLAAIVFHELTHQLLYLPGDASFNEALATTVEEEGLRRWLLAQGRTADLAAHVVQQEHYLEIVDLLRRARSELRVLYASGVDAQLMRERKRAVFATLRGSYRALTRQWPTAPFGTWFEGEMNNAHLASVATYYDCVPGFERELAAVGGDLSSFYRRVRQLAKLNQEARDAAVCAKS
ncbi:MAG: putative aminopeptidase [Gammaproteobacteria bacterium]|nr:putative aminopeptidase [Gammaproteobacteria bacterium]